MKILRMPILSGPRPASLLAACLLAASPWAMAQQTPLTGQMMGGRAGAAAPATAGGTAATAPLRERAAAPDTDAATDDRAQAAAALPADDAGATAAFRAAQVGDTTRHLLQLQADDRRPGARLPMLGDEASAGYDRYLKSFSHPIPEFYESSVGSNSGGANSGR